MPKPGKNPIIFVLLTVVIDTIGFGVIMPVLPRLIMEISAVDISAAARIGGLLLITFAALQFLFGPVLGNLSDRFGRRPVLLISLAAFSVNYALMGLAPNLFWLFIGRGLVGICGAVYAPANAYVADVTPPDRRAQAFGMIGAAFGLGFILGPAIGGFIGELGPRAPFFVASGLAALNFVYGAIVLPESLPRELRRPFSLARANPLGTLRAFRGQRAVLGLAAALFVWQLAFQVYPSTWSYYAIAKFQLPTAVIGGTLAASGVSLALVQGGLTGKIVKKLGEGRTALLGVVWGGSAFLAYAFISASWMLWPLLLLGGVQGVATPAINALMSRELGPERQGELQGGMASLMGLGSIVGPLALTQTLAYFSSDAARAGGYFFPGAAFVLSSLLSAVCFMILLSRLRANTALMHAAEADVTRAPDAHAAATDASEHSV